MPGEEPPAKKRGRPRKTPLPETASAPSTAPAKTTKPRKSSPKTSTEPAKPRTRKAKPAVVEVPKSDAAVLSTSSQAASASSASLPIPESQEPQNQTTSVPPPPRPTPTPAAMHHPSKILTAVRELSTKASPAPKPAASTKPVSHLRTPSKTSTPKPPAKTAATTPPPKPSAKAPAPPNPPAPKPHLGDTNYSGASSSARPSTGPKQLPSNYKPVARKVTMAFVALPIAIVTSYVLWQRLVLGEERKVLSKEVAVDVETKRKGSE